AEDRDARGAVELDEIAGAGGGTADGVERHARLIGLGGAQGRGESAGTAQDDAMQKVADRCDAIGADAGEVALDDVLLSAVIDFNACTVQPDDVARPGGGAADGVEIAAGNFDAEQVI